MNEVQFLVADQPWPVKLLEPTMAAKGRSRSCRFCAHLVLVEEVRLGVQEALVVEPDLHLVGPEEGDQFLDQLQRRLGERLGLQVALDSGLEPADRASGRLRLPSAVRRRGVGGKPRDGAARP